MQITAHDYAIKVKQDSHQGWNWSVLDKDGVEISNGAETCQESALRAADINARSIRPGDQTPAGL